MLQAFAITHQVLAAFALLVCVIFVGMLIARPAKSPFSGMLKVFYGLNMGATGLAGLTGLVITVLGPWTFMIFPWIGLGLLIVHGVAGVFAKNAFMVGNKTPAVIGGVIQFVALVAASGLMAVKLF